MQGAAVTIKCFSRYCDDLLGISPKNWLKIKDAHFFSNHTANKPCRLRDTSCSWTSPIVHKKFLRIARNRNITERNLRGLQTNLLPKLHRVLYLKFGETSTCLGQRTPNKLLNCWPYNFIAKVKVPTINGVYNITAYSVLEYRCSAVPDYEGVVIGTIHVGNPLFWIDGNNNFTSSPGRAITVRGCYKYCKQILLLPRMSTSSILSRDGRFNLLCC